MDAYSHLQKIDFMSHLTEPDLQALSKICKLQRFIAGEDIILQGDLTKRFFIIDEGAVHFRKTDTEGFEHPAGSKAAGDYFGKQMFSAEEPSEYTVEALGQASIYVVERSAFDELCKTNPDILKHMPEVVTARFKLTYGFKWLSEGEIVALRVFRHWTALGRKLGISLALVLVALIVRVVTGYFKLPIDDLIVLAVVASGLIIGAGLGVLNYWEWRDDMLVVTNKRVAQFERNLYSLEMVNQVPVNKIQSIGVHKTGPLQAALGISTLEIQVSGDKESGIVFEQIANADVVKNTIQAQQKLLRARQAAEQREWFRRRIDNELRHYVLQQPGADQLANQPKPKRSFWANLKATWKEMFNYEVRNGNTISWRKHWWGLVSHARRWLLLALGLALLLALYFFFLSGLVPGIAFFAVFAVLLIADFGGLAYEWEDWRNDIYMVTDRAVVDIERKPLGLSSTSKEALLVNVQDVKSHRPRLLNALLNFGEVEIRVGGAGGEPLVFYDVAKPEEIAAEIFKRLEEFRLKQRERETSLQSRNIVDALVAYHRLLMTERETGEPQVIATPAVAPEPKPSVPGKPDGAAGTPTPGPAPEAPVVRATRNEGLAEFPPADEFDEPGEAHRV